MSVTFHAELGETTGFIVACRCEANRREVEGGTTASYNGALNVLRAMRASLVPCDCIEMDVFITPVTDGQGPELNVTATNAHRLLAALFVASGADGEVSGELAAGELLARIDEANPYATDDPAYVLDRLADLRAVAEHAASLGRKVVWA